MYLAIQLCDYCKKVLAEEVPAIYPNVYGDHVTIWFNPSPEKVKEWDYILQNEPDRIIEFNIIGYAQDEKAQAVYVDQYDMGPEAWQNKYPHITISTAEGVPPVYSNELLEKRAGKMVGLRMGLCGTIKLLN